jgi:hypothetical protein
MINPLRFRIAAALALRVGHPAVERQPRLPPGQVQLLAMMFTGDGEVVEVGDPAESWAS